MNLFDALAKNFKTYYYYVPPCPRCHSPATGHFVKAGRESEWVFHEALRHGELVFAVDSVPEDNAFCNECGFTWPQEITGTWISNSRLLEEKKNRQTSEILAEEMAALEERESEHRSNFISRFIGKI